MTRNEALQLLNCNLSEMASRLNITTAAVAKWNKDQIPPLREYQIRELAAGRTPSGLQQSKQNVVHANN
ncbi:Cro/CI family transcriptional regulator [Acinetobacter sp. ANC 5045]|uniref:Cro/CI family transcriptional regulator n=1 Tax=Acinetobacter sp. ANC 5045 TaxID=2529851 RepID=UPI0010390B9F|nr:Cro/CI family transcriptional regulator [Acinetobacter sp. ANC 5045]TCB18993.1 ribonuclease D [Acinetobacter sp. ANC 5045]